MRSSSTSSGSGTERCRRSTACPEVSRLAEAESLTILLTKDGREAQPGRLGRESGREVVLPGTNWGSVGWHLLLLLALSTLTASWATWTFRAYQRSL
jgi:hypothetical protein